MARSEKRKANFNLAGCGVTSPLAPRDGVCPRCGRDEVSRLKEEREPDRVKYYCSCVACGIDYTEEQQMVVFAQEYMHPKTGRIERLERRW